VTTTVPAGTAASSACTVAVVSRFWTTVLANISSAPGDTNVSLSAPATSAPAYCSVAASRRLAAEGPAGGVRQLQAAWRMRVVVPMLVPAAAGVAGINAAVAQAAAMNTATFSGRNGALQALRLALGGAPYNFTVTSVVAAAACAGGGSACPLPTTPGGAAAPASGLSTSQQLGLGLGIALPLALFIGIAAAAAYAMTKGHAAAASAAKAPAAVAVAI